jgi:hypothetical protein
MCRPEVWVNATDLFLATALMYAAQLEDGEHCVRLLLGEPAFFLFHFWSVFPLFVKAVFDPFNHRVLNNLKRARLSRGHMIWLLAHPLPPPVSKLDRRQTGRLRKRNNLLTGEGGGRE